MRFRNFHTLRGHFAHDPFGARDLIDDFPSRRPRVPCIERGLRIIFECQLREFRGILTPDLCDDRQGEVDAGRDATSRDAIPVNGHAFVARLNA
jgi:hypothetical protein